MNLGSSLTEDWTTQLAVGRILVVDDDAALLGAVGRLLERAAHVVETASSGHAAIAAAEQASFDVALVDFQMPELTGLFVLQHLLARQPDCVRVLMSGRLDLPLAIDAVNTGSTYRILRKPFAPSELLSILDDCTAERARLQATLTTATAQSLRQQRRVLEECLAGEALQLAVQPIVSARDGLLAACEALLRSSHPALPGPLQILRAAEQCDMVDQVGDVVVDRAARWLERIPAPTRLFINLHPAELRRPDELLGRLSRLRTNAGRVVLEVTERSSLLDVPAWDSSLHRLAESGFRIAVDDLGAGYSSLSVLAALSPDYMKVDMSITRGVDQSEPKRRLLELLCRFADSSRACLVAEGVETSNEASTVIRCGAHYMQGYWIARPWLPDIGTSGAPSALPPWLQSAVENGERLTEIGLRTAARQLQIPSPR